MVPILRAGLVLLEQATTVLPSSVTYHVGYERDESTLQARLRRACGVSFRLLHAFLLLERLYAWRFRSGE